jgi:hypothetical protein
MATSVIVAADTETKLLAVDPVAERKDRIALRLRLGDPDRHQRVDELRGSSSHRIRRHHHSTHRAAIYPAPFWLKMLSGSIVITNRLAPGKSRTSAPYFGVMNASAHANPSSGSARAVPRTSR